MVKRWYVTARINRLNNYLCGPFSSARAAFLMVDPVKYAARRWQPNNLNMRNAIFSHQRIARDTPGTLPLEFLNLDDIIDASRKNSA